MLTVFVAIFTAAASASFASITPAANRPPHTDAVTATRQTVALAREQARDNDAVGATATLASAIRSEGFRQLSPEEQFQALRFGTFVANAAGDHRSALEWSKNACALPAGQGDPDIWHERLSAAYDLNDYADSADSVATIARRWPQTLEKINASAIHIISARLADNAALGKSHFELLQSLFDAKWLSYGEEPAWLWVDLARLLLDRRDIRSAKTVVARIDSPAAIVAMRVNKHFDKLRRADPHAFDVKKASVARVVHAEERVRANPGRLQPITQLQYVLLRTLQPERALRNADEVIAKAANGAGNKIYDDFNEYYRWVLDIRASSLWQLGRWDEALTQQRRAARYPEHGELNVSQALNLSAYYAKLGRVDEALDAVSDLGEMSPYGRMQLEAVGVISAIQRDDAGALDAHLGYMRAHRGDALSTYQAALLDANRLDAAGELLVERLRNVVWRADALDEMQIYVDAPMPPLVRTRQARWRAVVATPSVQAALTEVGRIEKVPLASPNL